MNYRGKLAIVAIFAIAAGASLSAIAYMRYQSGRATAYWGTTTAQLILNSPSVRLLKLASNGPADAPKLAVRSSDGAERIWNIVEAKEVTQARGFINLRRGLMIDASFHWDEPPPSELVDWEYALEFAPLPEPAGQEPAVILFAPAKNAAALLGEGAAPRAISTVPINKGLTAFFAEQFPEAPEGESKPAPPQPK